MRKSEIKKKLALDKEQKELLTKFLGVWKEMKEKNIGIILDYCIDSLSLTAFNATEVLAAGNEGFLDGLDDINDAEWSDGEAVDVEDCLEWGNVDIDYLTYDHFYSNLHVVFGDKTPLNASMTSAGL